MEPTNQTAPPPMQRCPCCGIQCIPTTTLRRDKPTCLMCTGHWCAAVRCAGVHGEELEREAAILVKNGVWTPWYAISMLAIDDAHLCGGVLLEINGAAAPPVRLTIARAPRRWQVVAARAICAGQQPDAELVFGAALAPYFGQPNVAATHLEIRRELAEACKLVIGEVVDVQIDVTPDPTGAGGFIASIQARVPADGDAAYTAPEQPATPTEEQRAIDALAAAMPARGRAEA